MAASGSRNSIECTMERDLDSRRRVHHVGDRFQLDLASRSETDDESVDLQLGKRRRGALQRRSSTGLVVYPAFSRTITRSGSDTPAAISRTSAIGGVNPPS